MMQKVRKIKIEKLIRDNYDEGEMMVGQRVS